MANIKPEILLKSVAELTKTLRIPGTVPGSDWHLLIEMYLVNQKARKEINQVLWRHIDD